MKRAIGVLAVLALVLGGAGQAKAGIISASDTSPSSGGSSSASGSDPTYTFTLSGTVSGYGTLNATGPVDSANGLQASGVSFTITSGAYAGTYSLYTLSGTGVSTVSTGTDTDFLVDNLIYPSNNAASGTNNGKGGLSDISGSSYLDQGGLIFSNGSGVYVNIWGDGGTNNYEIGITDTSKGTLVVDQTGETFTLSATPEPASMTLLAVGAVSLVGLRLRRRKADATVA